jgi:hypothetical protein
MSENVVETLKTLSLPVYEFSCDKAGLMDKFTAILDAHRHLNCPMIVFKIFHLADNGQHICNEYRFHGSTFTARLVWSEKTSSYKEKDVDDYLAAKAFVCNLDFDTACLPAPDLVTALVE